MDENRICWLSLALIPRLGNRSLWKLYNHFKSAEAILKASSREIWSVRGLKSAVREALIKKDFVRDPYREAQRLERENIRFICWEDKEYPEILRHIPYPPLFIFLKGSYLEDDIMAVGVVGTRYPSFRGRLFAEKLSEELASQGVTVVSGLAVGIDTSAHLGALRANGRTISVLGCGLDVPYPRQNVQLKDRISRSGAVISEYPLGVPPEKWRFPLRNRIVSGLSLGVVVVEAGLKSGALITAKLALEQGREVFAVPGPAGDYRSAGTNMLLKQGAKLVEKAEDIFDEIESLKELRRNRVSRSSRYKSHGCDEHYDGLEGRIMEVLSDTPLHIDVICRRIGKSVKELLPVLSSLEIRGQVRQLPGKHFIVERQRT